jgi:twitching motility protein PilT
MMASHGADELRLGTDQQPRMLTRGAPVRLSIPPTDDAMLQHLLEGILTPEREASLRQDGKLELVYEGHTVSLQARGDKSLDAVFRRAAAPPRAVAAPPAIAAPPRPVVQPPAVTPSHAPAPASAADAGVTSTALLQRAVSLGASDIHLLSGELPMLRIDGQLRPLEDVAPAEVEQLLDECSGDQSARAELSAGRSHDRAFSIEGLGRFRLNLYRTDGRLAAAIRVLPLGAPRLEELHFPVALDELLVAPHGLVIVCGPTGSGKSATLAALAQEALRRRGGVLITLEDPVEYIFDRAAGAIVRQREIGRDVRDFTVGLRDALREDPDILLVGEMRDAESIQLALTAAETGHLVLASLHSTAMRPSGSSRSACSWPTPCAR